MQIHRFPLAAALAVAASVVFGAAPPSAPFGALATREDLLADAARATPDAFPDADTVVILDAEHVLYDEEGRYLDLAEACVKILTERGRRDERTQTVFYTEHYSRPPHFAVAEIFRPDGTVVPIDVASHLKEQIDRSLMGSNIYDPADKIVTLSIPDLQIGDCLHLVIEREAFKARTERSWSDYAVFESTSPILHALYEVQSPDALPIRSVRLRDASQGPAENDTWRDPSVPGATFHRWVFRDIPRYFPEPDMPRAYTCVQRLLLSTEADWRDLSRWYDRLCAPRLAAVNDAMREKVAELTRDAPDDDARIRAIFDFVSQQVRYLGITDEDVSPGYEPHDVSLTFDNRHGVCRDKAALLVAMLRLAGIPAHPVLISVGARKDPDVPQPYFNHAIAAVDRGAGEGAARYRLMDPTNEKTRDLFPAYLYNEDFLVATPEGETLLNAGPAPVADNLLRVETTGTLNADRSLSLVSSVSFDGLNDSIYRNSFARWKPEERDRYFERVLRARLPGAELLSAVLTPEDLGDTSQPLRARLSYHVPDVPVDGEGAWIVRLPWLSPALGFSARVLGSTGLDKRRFPLELLPTCGEEETLTIAIAPGAVGEPLSLPSPVHVRSGALDFAHEASFSDGTLRASRHTHLLAAQVAPADYAALRADLHAQEAALRRQAVFAPGSTPPPEVASALAPLPPPPSPDAEFLLSASTVALDSESAWSIVTTNRLRVLTYAGVKDNAEQSFDYNPVWDSVELLSATVTAPDGTVQTVSDKEVNLMDAGWVASAPRYPAAKTLVVALPGVQVGSVIETVVRRTCRDRPWFSLSSLFRGAEPATDTSLVVTLPEDAPFALCVRETDVAHPATIGSADGRTVYAWRFSNLPPQQPEGNKPPAWLLAPYVRLSSRSDLAALHAWILGRFRAALDRPGSSSAAHAKGAALAHGPDGALLSREDAVRAIRDFVATSIRTAGPNAFFLPDAIAFTAPDVTLADGYGHAADKLLLTAALLEGAGIADYELVPVCSHTSESPTILQTILDTPAPSTFSKLLLRIPAVAVPAAVADGTDSSVPAAAPAAAPVPAAAPAAAFWLGDTDQYALLDATPSEHELRLLPDGSVAPLHTAWPSRSDDGYAIDLAADGSATVRSVVRHTGGDIGPFRKAYLEMRPEDRRRHHLELVGSLGRGAVPAGDLETDLDATPATRAFAATIADYAVRDGALLHLAVPGLPNNPLGIGSAIARENDFYLPPCREVSRHEVLIRLPPETEEILVAPPTETISFPGLGTVECRTLLETDPATGRVAAIRLVRTVRVAEGIVPAADYGRLVALTARLQHPRFYTLLLRLTEK